MNMIETHGLTRRFGQTVAVNNLNLVVPAQAIYGFIGPNGAGKTTTLRLLAGLLAPNSGEIYIAGRRLGTDSRAIRRRIGYMPDFFGLYPDLKVWEYLDFFARCYDLPPERRPQVVEELLELVDLGGKYDAFVHTLSRGMQQRLCLARLLVHDPDVLLLDEPASGLDPQARAEIRELLRELGRMGKTILVSSHILSELADICDHVGIIEQGNLLASGPVAEIRRRLLDRRTVQIAVLDRKEDLLAYLQGRPGVDNPALTPRGLEMTFQGDEAALAGLLRELVEAGFAVVSFSQERDLEDLFFRITKGAVA